MPMSASPPTKTESSSNVLLHYFFRTCCLVIILLGQARVSSPADTTFVVAATDWETKEPVPDTLVVLSFLGNSSLSGGNTLRVDAMPTSMPLLGADENTSNILPGLRLKGTSSLSGRTDSGGKCSLVAYGGTQKEVTAYPNYWELWGPAGIKRQAFEYTALSCVAPGYIPNRVSKWDLDVLAGSTQLFTVELQRLPRWLELDNEPTTMTLAKGATICISKQNLSQENAHTRFAIAQTQPRTTPKLFTKDLGFYSAAPAVVLIAEGASFRKFESPVRIVWKLLLSAKNGRKYSVYRMNPGTMPDDYVTGAFAHAGRVEAYIYEPGIYLLSDDSMNNSHRFPAASGGSAK